MVYPEFSINQTGWYVDTKECGRVHSDFEDFGMAELGSEVNA
jgi:hypothetical protein